MCVCFFNVFLFCFNFLFPQLGFALGVLTYSVQEGRWPEPNLFPGEPVPPGPPSDFPLHCICKAKLGILEASPGNPGSPVASPEPPSDFPLHR